MGLVQVVDLERDVAARTPSGGPVDCIEPSHDAETGGVETSETVVGATAGAEACVGSSGGGVRESLAEDSGTRMGTESGTGSGTGRLGFVFTVLIPVRSCRYSGSWVRPGLDNRNLSASESVLSKQTRLF